MENVRSCTQKMFAVRLLGSSVPAALAVLTGVGALVPSAVRAAQMETEPIRASRDFADDTVVDVSSAHVTLSTPASGGSTTIHVAEGHTLVLRNTRHDDENGTADWSQGHVVDATSGERLTLRRHGRLVRTRSGKPCRRGAGGRPAAFGLLGSPPVFRNAALPRRFLRMVPALGGRRGTSVSCRG